ncbi:MAG: DUF5677 domain-containing protein [Planctomycetota bacterium]
MDDVVARTVDKWLLSETHDRLVSEGLEATPGNYLCLSVIPVAHTYCRAILRLAGPASTEQCMLPTMGLLRVLTELALRTCWCLMGPEPDVKVTRWLKQSYMERKKLLERTVVASIVPDKDKKEYREEIEKLSREIDGIDYEPAGGLWDCIGELPEVYKDIYRLLYGPFHRGIHPDLVALGETLKEEASEIMSLGDFAHIPPRALMKSCLNIVFQLVAPIWTYYGWDTERLKNEHIAIVTSLGKQEDSQE